MFSTYFLLSLISFLTIFIGFPGVERAVAGYPQKQKERLNLANNISRQQYFMPIIPS